MRELADTDAAYRSITASWMQHSPLPDLFAAIATDPQATLILTTDHGTIRVENAVRVAATRDVNPNTRYKIGRDLGVSSSRIITVKDPGPWGLPSPGFAAVYIFATGRDFFAYPTNFNTYARHLAGTLQHGGVSLSEMLLPFITLTPR